MTRARRLAAVAALAVAIPLSPLASDAAVAPTGTVLVYGDSILYESRYALADALDRPGWTVVSRAYPGTAPCDWVPWIAADLAAYQPTVVLVETAGNWSRPCVGADPTSVAFLDRYRADLTALAVAATATGARVVLVKAPPMADPAWDLRVRRVGAIMVDVARTVPGVSVSGAARAAVSRAGRYASTLPCLPDETAAVGCAPDGTIEVRTVRGADAGVHLCPDGLAPGYPYVCRSGYASGEVRYGRAAARVALRPPAPLYRAA